MGQRYLHIKCNIHYPFNCHFIDDATLPSDENQLVLIFQLKGGPSINSLRYLSIDSNGIAISYKSVRVFISI